MVVVGVVMMMSGRAEKTPRDMGWARGVWWRSRGATVSRGGRLVVHGRKGLEVCGGQGKRRGSWGRRGGGDRVRMGQVGAGVIMWMLGVLIRVRVSVGNPGLSLRISPGDEVPVLELGTPGLLRCQLELDKHHVITYTQRQGEGRATRQEVTDLLIKKGEKGLSDSMSLLLCKVSTQLSQMTKSNLIYDALYPDLMPLWHLQLFTVKNYGTRKAPHAYRLPS